MNTYLIVFLCSAVSLFIGARINAFFIRSNTKKEIGKDLYQRLSTRLDDYSVFYTVTYKEFCDLEWWYRQKEKDSNFQSFDQAFSFLQKLVHENAKDKGWWDNPRNAGESIALMHSELSEALEALRKGNPDDDKCPEFSNLEIEFADTIIRIMDTAEERGLNISGAILAKHEFNKTRPYKHGKKF